MLLHKDSESGIPSAVTLEIRQLLKDAAGDFYENTRCNKIREVICVEVSDDGALMGAYIVMNDSRDVHVDCSGVATFRYTLGECIRWDVTLSHRVSRAAW